jgi:hypothetical protein
VFTDGALSFVEFNFGTSQHNLNRTVTATRSGSDWVANLTNLSPNTRYYWELYAETTDGWWTTTDTYGWFETGSNNPTWVLSTTDFGVSASSYTFPSATAGYSQQTARPIYVDNTGAVTLTGVSASITNGSDRFEITQQPANTIAGDDDSTIRVRPVTGLGAGAHSGVMTVTSSNGGSRSINLSFTVTATLPVITTQPISQTITEGQSVAYTVEATGATSYQWWSSSNGTTWFNIGPQTAGYSGGASEILSVDTSIGSFWVGSHYYRVDVINAAGTVTSNHVTLTVNSAHTAPTISIQPADGPVAPPGAQILIATAGGNPTPTLQWQINSGTGWNNISGAIGSSLNVTNLALNSGTHQFRCIATNSVGQAISNIVSLIVTPPLTVPAAITNLNTAPFGNGQVTLSWSAPNNGGSPILRYEFRQRSVGGQWGTWTSTGSTTISHNVTGLSGEYEFQVRAVNAHGAANESNTVLWQAEVIGIWNSVTVIGGTGATGSGTYASGTLVNISAGVPPAGQRFVKWTSDYAVVFTNAYAATTTFTMPYSGVTVTAVFEQDIANPDQLTFVVSSTQSMKDRDILIPIHVSNNNNALNAISVTVNFDGTRLEWQPLGTYSFGNASTHPWTLGGFMPFAFDTAPSTIGTNLATFMFMAMGGVDTANGTLITLRLRVKDNAPEGDANISLSFTSVGDSRGALVATQYNNIPGKVTVTNIIPGDLNGDGVIDIFDALYLARALNGWSGYILCPIAADTNGDGVTDIFDALFLARHLNGWQGYEILGIRDG